MACDICGVVGTTLEPLHDQYQTREIKQICPSCARDVNAQLWKIRAINQSFLKVWLAKFMTNRKNKKGGA